jgi:excisionase family DNA binding protein
MTDRLLTAEEVGEMLRVTPGWVYAQSRIGRIPTITLGRYRRYRLEAIDAWLRELEAEERAAPARPMSIDRRSRPR